MGKKPEKDLYQDEAEMDSDTEALQEAFAAGILKPGLNIEIRENKGPVNKVDELLKAKEKITLDLPWIERLDVLSERAPLAPELKLQIDEAAQKHMSSIVVTNSHSGRPPPIQFDDIKRESAFYRQAQNAVLTVMPKLKELNIATQRPEDYYAQMAKSDVHMQKVKLCMIYNKTKEKTLERIRHQREQRKSQKTVTARVKLEKEQKKREFLNKLKSMRRGKKINMSFLDEINEENTDENKKSVKIYKSGKRLYKNRKFGMGGKKRGMKRNTRESTFGIPTRQDKNQFYSRLNKKRLGKEARKKLKKKAKAKKAQ